MGEKQRRILTLDTRQDHSVISRRIEKSQNDCDLENKKRGGGGKQKGEGGKRGRREGR